MQTESSTADAVQKEADGPEDQATQRLDMKALFSSDALEKKKTSPQWHNRNSTAHHEKRIGMAPKGTRRSMGKR